MEEKKAEIIVNCTNDGVRHKVEAGTTLAEISKKWCSKVKVAKDGTSLPVLIALVDHNVNNLGYRIYEPHTVEFLTYASPEGRACYIHSLVLVLQKAVSEIFPDKVLVVEHSLPSGIYCEVVEIEKAEDGRNRPYFIKDDEIEALKARMQELIAADLPFVRKRVPAEEAIAIFEEHHQSDKAKLIRSLGQYSVILYDLEGWSDTFHGPLLLSTGMLSKFDLIPFSHGLCLQPPVFGKADKVMPQKRQSKIATALEDYAAWCGVVGIKGVGSLNTAITEGSATPVINLAESLHERKYAAIADMIYQRRGQVKFVFIAGPSSSGKTSSSLRIALQCKVLGLNPKVIELDNYFVDRDRTPLDEDGEKDYESLYAMDLEYLNKQLNELCEGKEVEIPKFDFRTGCRAATGTKLKLEENDILIMEGIHALNPEMTSAVDSSRIFRVYVSALTSLNLDENNNISTSDNRLLRRMVRDNRVRGVDPESTIMRWPSVRRGEVRNIFPFQENADVIFNSALIFELPMLKYYAEPLLRRIAPNSPAYPEAARMLRFLSYITALSPAEIATIPPTSIMREFIGGQTL